MVLKQGGALVTRSDHALGPRAATKADGCGQRLREQTWMHTTGPSANYHYFQITETASEFRLLSCPGLLDRGSCMVGRGGSALKQTAQVQYLPGPIHPTTMWVAWHFGHFRQF